LIDELHRTDDGHTTRPPAASVFPMPLKSLCLIFLTLAAMQAHAHNVRYGVVTQIGIDSNSGVIADAPSRISKTLLSNKLATEDELRGPTFAVVVALFMPSILGKQPQNWNWYVPPDLRVRLRVGDMVRLEESDWQGFGTARWRIVKEIFTRDGHPVLYKKCSDVFEVHLCIERELKKDQPTQPEPEKSERVPAESPAPIAD
jgi:hypothetical protein